jgi:hypothetical protein
MSETDSTDPKPEAAPEAPESTADAVPQLPEEWKPEPREWTWKDLFTAPMLAFKPKCMLISVLTFLVIGAFCWLWFSKLLGQAGAGNIYLLGPVPQWIGIAVCAALFGVGATLVSVFMKADLLDDEFLSLKEALGQFKGRIAAAVMVPLFMIATLAGFKLLIWGGVQLCSIPYAGSALLLVLYPFAFLLGLFTVLLSIGVLLSVFVGPAVVSVRKHGWFDNVIDTFEAVGTKPHVLVGNLALTMVMLVVCYGIGHGSMALLSAQAKDTGAIKGGDMAVAEAQSAIIEAKVVGHFDPFQAVALQVDNLVGNRGGNAEITNYHKVTGSILSVWKILLTGLIAGYAINVFLAGGMLTYLAVREDDYWDDEDLEDLDQLAKELEEEAKREEEAAASAAADTVVQDEDKKDDKPEEKAEDKKDEKSEEKADDDAKTDDEKPAEDDKADDKADDKKADEDKKNDDKPAEDEKSDDKKADEDKKDG